MVVVAVNADALPQIIAIGVGPAGQSAFQSIGVHGVPGQAGAVTLIVDVAIRGASSAEIIDTAVGRWTDTNSIADHKVSATLNGGSFSTLIVDVGESIPWQALTLTIHHNCIDST